MTGILCFTGADFPEEAGVVDGINDPSETMEKLDELCRLVTQRMLQRYNTKLI